MSRQLSKTFSGLYFKVKKEHEGSNYGKKKEISNIRLGYCICEIMDSYNSHGGKC